MVDSIGYRAKFAIIVPSTNTAVQAEMDAMRPHGVSNQVGRFFIPDGPIRNDADFNALMDNIRATMGGAVKEILTCQPDRLVLGMSSETFWDGVEGSRKLIARMREEAGGLPVTTGADAVRAALSKYPGVKRIAVITPYMPPGDAQVHRFFTDCGFEPKVVGLRGTSPVQYAHISEQTLRDAIIAVNGPDVDAIVQVGTNLAMARLAGIAEFWLDKPVIAINTAIYWHALRDSGIEDRFPGFGSLLLRH